MGTPRNPGDGPGRSAVSSAHEPKRSDMRRLLRVAGVVAAAVLASAGPAAAHPLGNFTVNHLSRITVARDAVQVRYVLDLAEIPAFALDRSLDPRGTPSPTALAAWADAHARSVAPQLRLVVDGRPVALTPNASSVRPRPGAGGLPTLYFSATFSVPVAPGAHRIAYRDDTEPGRLGWKDVVAGTGAEPTDELSRYPDALLGSPRARSALVAGVDASGRITVDAAGAQDDSAATMGSAPLARSNALSDVLSKGARDPLVVIGALLLAVALGALHALEPGHGKTLLAVSLVGARATPRQAIVLASALTVAHTAGVLALGVLVMVAAQWFVPEQIYPAITLHQIGYGLALIVAFSVGLAAVLTVLGLAVVRGAGWLVSRPRFERAARFAPLVTAFVIAAVGAVMVGQGFAAQGIGVPVPLVAALVLAAIVGYAFAWHQHGAPRRLAA